MPIARRAAAHNLKRWREDLGWSQKSLADRAGVSQRTISNLEDEDAHSPKLYSLSRVCAALGVEPFSALIPGVSLAASTAAVLSQIVQAFMSCDDDGRAEILHSAQREARRAIRQQDAITAPVPGSSTLR